MRSIVEVFYKKSLDNEEEDKTLSLKIAVDEGALCNDTFIEKEIARRLRPDVEVLGVVYPIADSAKEVIWQRRKNTRSGGLHIRKTGAGTARKLKE